MQFNVSGYPCKSALNFVVSTCGCVQCFIVFSDFSYCLKEVDGKARGSLIYCVDP